MHIDYCKIRILLTVCIFRLNISQIDIYIFVQVNYFERNKISGGSQRDTPPNIILYKKIYTVLSTWNTSLPNMPHYLQSFYGTKTWKFVLDPLPPPPPVEITGLVVLGNSFKATHDNGIK